MFLQTQNKTQEPAQAVMGKSSGAIVLLLMTACMLFVLPAVAAEYDGNPPVQPDSSHSGTQEEFLFSDSVETNDLQTSPGETGKAGKPALRSRSVTLNLHRLRPRVGAMPSKQLVLNLFDDVIVRAKRTKNYTNASNSLTWIGEVENIPHGIAILVVRENNNVYGTVELPRIGKFSIYPNPDGTHTIEQIDENATLSGEDDSRVPDSSKIPPPVSSLESRPVEISNDDGSIIDVFVAYDQDASGGSVAAADAQAYAELFIAYTNQSYENSNMSQRAWLVGSVDGFDYTDPNSSSLNADLDAATNGTISGLHAKRDEYHADLVVFFAPYSPSSCSGLAWVQTANNWIGWNIYGFAAMEACSYGQGVFAHELGHNMGSQHDWYVNTNTAPASIAHGYVDLSNGFRTIMSYSNRCSAAGVSCPRVAHFSNPLVNYGGAATGVASGSSTSCALNEIYPVTECDADNTTNFNTKANITAQFRDSRVTWTGAVNSSWATAGNWTINEGAPGSTTQANRVPRSFDNVYIPSGLATYPTITGNMNARELVIEDGATLNMTSGTLTVGWSWEDDGGFNATGGKVVFSGPIGVIVTSASTFNDVEIGTGSDTSVVTLDSDIDIDGNLDIMAGATLNAGAYTINIGGNWAEADATGFNPETSTVICDGTSQTINKLTSSTLLDEDFSEGDGRGCGCSTAYLPSGWTRQSAWYGGELSSDGDAIAAGNGWLHTPAVTLNSELAYTLSFYFNQYSGSDTLRVYYGTSPGSASMTNLIGNVTATGTADFSFSVPTSGSYYIGFHHDGTGWSYMDDLLLTGTSSLRFYNIQVASGTTTFNADVAVSNILQTDNGATADFSTNEVTVEATVANGGSIKQTRTASNGVMTEFGRITDAAGTTDKYLGVEITPSSGSMGLTSVAIMGTGGINRVQRSYEITPATSQTALTRFYYRQLEQNGQVNPRVYHWNNGSWDDLGAVARGGFGDGMYVEAITDSYSPFVLADDPPTLARIGKVTLSYVGVLDALEMLVHESHDPDLLLKLLASMNPELAAALADAEFERLLTALIRELDPDDDDMVALISWHTLEERGTIGFYVERQAEDETWERLNNDMLPGMINAPLGAEYLLFDPQAGQSLEYLYRLIEVEAWGTEILHGPWLLWLQD